MITFTNKQPERSIQMIELEENKRNLIFLSSRIKSIGDSL